MKAAALKIAASAAMATKGPSTLFPRHPMRTLLPAAVALLLAPAAFAQDAQNTPAGDSWTRANGYAGVSGGFVFGADADDTDDLDHDDLRYTDQVSARHGWQATLEGGAVIPLGRADWVRLRVGGEGGYTRFTLDPHRDGFSGDSVSGRAGFWRVGPAAAADFRIKGTPWSFTAGVGAGVAFLDLDATVVNGGSVRDAGDNQVTAYVSGLVAANYALDRHTDLTLGFRVIGLADTDIRGTPTTVGPYTYEVRHDLRPATALELGLRFTF